MLSVLFGSGAVAVLGLAVLALEGLWLVVRRPALARQSAWVLLAGAALMLALLAGLRAWPWPWLAAALVIALVAHTLDMRCRAQRFRSG